MELWTLLNSLKIPYSDVPNLTLAGITCDTRRLRPGVGFVVVRGSRLDGASFIPQAEASGTSIIFAEESVAKQYQNKMSTPMIVVPNARLFLAQSCATFYAPLPETVVAVTGTNGKTSVTDYVRQLWTHLGLSSVSIGTLGILDAHGQEIGNCEMTTPDAELLAQTLGEVYAQKITHVAIEASSHALHQYRLDGLNISTAGFTNLTQDHLDYHETMDAYFESKSFLFSRLIDPNGIAVLNHDVSEYAALAHICQRRGVRVTSYGTHGTTYKIQHIASHNHGQILSLEMNGEIHNVPLNVVGDFQAYNVLCAFGLVLGAAPFPTTHDVLPLLSLLRGVPGRLELMGFYHGGAVYVDFAHTPDALERTLTVLRPQTKGRLIVLFGCGGNRDTKKRPIMGRIAAQLADLVIVSDDNPRWEDPAIIRQEIMQGAPDALEMGERGYAIDAGLQMLQPGDTLLIAGKGHEKGQIIQNTELPFSDREFVKGFVSL